MFGATLLFAIAASASATVPASPEPPVSQIEVSGRGTVRTMPDIARLAYSVRGEGTTSDEAVQSVETIRKAIADGLNRLTPAEFEDGALTIQTIRGSDCKEAYDTPVLSKGSCAIAGYIAVMIVHVRIASVKEAATAVGLIGKLKGHEPQVDSFDLADFATAQKSALAAAVKDARASAEALAVANGGKLGRLINMTTQPQGDGEPRPPALAIAPLTNNPPAVFAPVKVNITPGPIETSASVTATYELVP